jgi:DNA primase
MNKQDILNHLDFRTFYREAVPSSLRGDPQASGKCPFHDDQRASLSVNFDKRGGPWTCHAGCGKRECNRL